MDNPFILYSVLAIVFIAFLTMVLGINQAFKNLQNRKKTIQKIKNFREEWPDGDAVEEEKPKTLTERFTKIIARTGSKFSKEGGPAYSILRLRFLRAGIRNPYAAQVYWAGKLWLPLILVAVFIGARTLLPHLHLMKAQFVLLGVIVSGIVGVYLPDIWLILKGNVRKTKIVKDIPDALDLLVVCVEAGLGLDSAFNRVADEMKSNGPELSEEFKMLNLELRAGKPRQEALRNLSERVNIDSLKSLVTLLIQTDMFGTGIAKSLRVFSDSFRTKRFQIAEETAAKLPVKMLIPMIFFIFPTFMAIMVGPSAISVWDNWLSK